MILTRLADMVTQPVAKEDITTLLDQLALLVAVITEFQGPSLMEMSSVMWDRIIQKKMFPRARKYKRKKWVKCIKYFSFDILPLQNIHH